MLNIDDVHINPVDPISIRLYILFPPSDVFPIQALFLTALIGFSENINGFDERFAYGRCMIEFPQYYTEIDKRLKFK